MPVWIRNYARFIIAACLIVSFSLVAGEAQTRKKKRTRRTAARTAPKPVITNPAITPPEAMPSPSPAADVKIISTADSAQETTETTPARKTKTPEQEEMQQSITTLSTQVNKLTDRLTRMQEDDRYQMDMERLTRAEQRAEQLRSQLMDIHSKIADFQAKLEMIEFALRPENIESSTAGYGSTRPEQAREARKKQLEAERSRVQAQLKLAETSKTRLEMAVSNADAEVDLLRAKLDQRRAQMDSQPIETTPPAKPRKP